MIESSMEVPRQSVPLRLKSLSVKENVCKHSSQEAKKETEKLRIAINSKFQTSTWHMMRSLSQRRMKERRNDG